MVEQILVVAAIEKTTACISMHEKDLNGNWIQIINTLGFIGKNGLGKTQEGDEATPIGEFYFKKAFGIADDPGCKIGYQKITEDDWWSSDSDYKYNQMIKLNEHPKLNKDVSEHIIDYNDQYQYCLNISYNEKGIPGLGSAIFLHCINPHKTYTQGCIAIPKEDMLKVLKNVKKGCLVVINYLDILTLKHEK